MLVVASAQERRTRRHADSRSQGFLGDRLMQRCHYTEAELEQLLAVSRPVREPIPIMGAGANIMEGVLLPVIAGGAGFASYDQIITALTTNGKGQHLSFAKAAGTSSTNSAASLWGNTGLPAAGAFGTALTARTIDKTTTGALPYSNPTSPATMHLLHLGAGSALAFGTLILYDRLAEYPLNGSVTSGTFSSVTLPARDAGGATSGNGVLMFIENDVAGATSAGVNLTLSYTNQAGTAAQSTGAQAIVGGAVQRILMDRIWIPLATGDSGVRTIQTYTLSATATSTKMTIVLARVLAFLPLMVANAYVERDLVLQLASMPRIFDGTAFAFAAMTNTTTTPVTGKILIAEN